MTAFHVLMGSLGILSGFATMFAPKGTRAHRVVGRVYVLAMLAMTASGFIIAVFIKPQMSNVVAASLTFYLVATGWMTMHRNPASPHTLERVAFALGCVVVILAFGAGTYAANLPKGAQLGIPTGAFFFFGLVALLAAGFDLRLILRRNITRTQRLVRHLWRMGFALFIATASLFLGQTKHLPAWLTEPNWHLVPVLVCFLLLVFWLIRVRFPPWSRRSGAVAPPQVSTP